MRLRIKAIELLPRTSNLKSHLWDAPLTCILYPCRCLCLGFSQITRTTPFRFTILHLSQIFLTEALTFIIPYPAVKEIQSSNFLDLYQIQY
jgi:hypothetical protein